MKRSAITVLVAILSVLVFVIPAQADGPGTYDPEAPNDPAVNEWANACLAGGSLEGRCEIDFDGNGVVPEEEVDWAWDCGWYLIRYEEGMLSRSMVPDRCESMLPPTTTTCFYLANTYREMSREMSAQLDGPLNQLGNFAYFNNLDCTGESFRDETSGVISAGSYAEGLAICQGLLGTNEDLFFRALNDMGWLPESNFYACGRLMN